LLLVAAAPLGAQSRACDGYFTPLVVPAGSCVRLFADTLGPVRQIIVHPSGQLVAALDAAPGLVRLYDRDRDGRADQIIRFGPGQGGTGVTWRSDWLYFAADSGVIRYRWPATAEAPDSEGEWLIRDLPVGEYERANTMKGIAVGADGRVYLSIGSETDNCQVRNEEPRSPGRFPCPELSRRAGIWRLSPPAAPGGTWTMERFATGLRNAAALAIDPATGRLWALTHGRDLLNRLWGWDDSTAANQPAEMLEQIVQNGDYGWPYCQGNWTRRSTILIRAPEYASQAGIDCTLKTLPVMGFAGHWTPMAIAVVNSTAASVPHPGLFIAFHGSRSRSPLPEDGHFVVFVPLDSNSRPSGDFRIILHSSAPPGSLRPAGVAVTIDGYIYVTDDEHGRIYRIEPNSPTAH
jgi:glucose/arabinose dehydrogenase